MTPEQALLYALLAAASVTDLSRRQIPNILTVGGMLAGLLVNGWMAGLQGLSHAVLGCAGSVMLLWLAYAIGGIGAGDVKLFGAIGAIAGLPFSLYSFACSAVVAGGIGCVLLVSRGAMRTRFVWPLMAYWLHLRLDARSNRMRPRFGAVSPFSNPLRFPFMLAVVPGVIMAQGLLKPEF